MNPARKPTSANLLVKRHGEDAPIHAAMRADAMLEKGGLEGYAILEQVLKAAEKLLSNKPPAGGF